MSACGAGAPSVERVSTQLFFPQSVASGDPRPNSVVLWTRVVDEERSSEPLELQLTLALDPEMQNRVELDGQRGLTVTAEPAFDHCVKVRVLGLLPGQHYYYQFTYRSDGGVVATRVGRTKTAPAEDADVQVKFAVASCQNFEERWYYAYRLLVGRELDFVIHLGDYVYESGNPDATGPRSVVFGRPEEALELGEGRLVARSLDNYRDLYRTYRSDPDLQRMHESVPFIAIWDDHEFSNDCHGATGTYDDGRTDETDLARRAAADRAWFEYMPMDDAHPPATELDPSRPFPDDLTIHRSFVFGRHLELSMTDVRRYRPDHVISEDAFPGAMFVRQEQVLSDEGTLPETPAVACVDIEEYPEHAAFLRQQAETLGFRSQGVSGFLSVPYINTLILQTTEPSPPPSIATEDPGVIQGYAYHQLLKSSGFSSAGARYLVASEPFGLLSRKLYRETGGASENLLGAPQRAWLLETLRQSTRTFKLWGSSLCFMPREIDLTAVDSIPEELRTRILITAEDWDGCPNERAALLEELAGVQNVVVLSGDLHCFFVGTPFQPGARENRVIEFVTGSVSSSTWLEEIRSIAASDPSLPPSVVLAASGVGGLLADPVSKPNPHLAFQELERNGVTVMRADGEALRAELLLLPSELVTSPPEQAGPSWQELTSSEEFRVNAATGELERDVQGRVWRWDSVPGRWVTV